MFCFVLLVSPRQPWYHLLVLNITLFLKFFLYALIYLSAILVDIQVCFNDLSVCMYKEILHTFIHLLKILKFHFEIALNCSR